mgnify:CR=1 FL=1
MHTRLLVPALFVSLLCTAGAGEAAVRVDCRPANGGPCVAPPAPVSYTHLRAHET